MSPSPNRARIEVRKDLDGEMQILRKSVVLPQGSEIVGQVERAGDVGFLIRFANSNYAMLTKRGSIQTLPQNKVEAALKGLDSNDSAELAELVKSWRSKAGINTATASDLLGLPVRTIEGIEQGRGFKYSKLLVLAIEAFD